MLYSNNIKDKTAAGLTKIKSILEEHNIEIDGLLHRSGTGGYLCAYATAEKKGCDLIVMASHGRRAVGRLLLGSQANEVLAHSKIPALIVR